MFFLFGEKKKEKEEKKEEEKEKRKKKKRPGQKYCGWFSFKPWQKGIKCT